jgi:hypothetical protein
MKKPRISPKAPSQGKPLDPERLTSGAQTEATAGRQKVREAAYPMRAPRQTRKG